MDDLNIKQMTLAAKTIAEEKNLPEETVFRVIEMAIAAAWRRENGKRDQNVRAELDTNSGQAEVFVQFEVVEDGEAYNPLTNRSTKSSTIKKPSLPKFPVYFQGKILR